MKKYFLIFISTLVVLAAGIGTLYFNVESVQHKVYDVKADLIGTNRTVIFYSPISGQEIDRASDKEVRYTYDGSSIRVWLGSKNQKVHSNLPFIIKDNK